jgi:hypothetical protein
MQVEGVELVEREEVDELLDEVGRIEVARHVQEDPAIAEARLILDLHGGDGPSPWSRRGGGGRLCDTSPPSTERAHPVLELWREELAKCLKAAK